MYDSQPEEKKTLVEAKLKKASTVKAPVAGPKAGSRGTSQLLHALRTGGHIRNMEDLNDLLCQAQLAQQPADQI